MFTLNDIYNDDARTCINDYVSKRIDIVKNFRKEVMDSINCGAKPFAFIDVQHNHKLAGQDTVLKANMER